jgi:hypothetical protein
MKTPFTVEEFFNVFEKYNSTVFPFQLIIVFSGIIALFLFHSKYSQKNKFIGSFLGSLWIWMGLVYHFTFFAEINKAAFVFGAAFILQGLLILINTFSQNRLIFIFKSRATEYVGYFFILFGLILYPLIGYFFGSTLARTITLGLPCPSTILTFGFLLLTQGRFPKYLLIIPSLWAIIGLSAAINFGVYQDFMIIIAAVLADILLIWRRAKAQKLQLRYDNL